MKNIHAPRFLTDLYRDLRDRRMLLPAVALAAALIAVPAMLSKSSSAPPPLAPAAQTGGLDHPTAAQSAVLAVQPGITDYRKRLEQLKSKNPFRQQFTSLPKGAKLNTTGTSASTSTSSTTSSSAITPTGSTTSSGTSSSVAPSPTIPNLPKPKLVFFQLERRIDVKVGPAGSLKTRKDLKQLTLLPSVAKPLVAYLGTNEAGDKALFLVSNDVATAAGHGVCLAPASNCQYMTMKVGDVETFHYASNPGTPYKLKLLAINQIVKHSTTSLPSSSGSKK